jgi:t-SNARE complex subunit (syntaxin)
MQSRLSELGKGDVVIEMDTFSNNQDDPSDSMLPEFFEEVGQIKTLMSLIRRNIKSIQDIYQKQALSADGKLMTNELESLLDSTNSSASQIRNKLKVMKAEIDKSDDAQKRIRSNMHSTLTKKFLEIMTEYQTLQTQYKEKFHERVKRQAEIVKPNISDEEVNKIINSGNSDGLFTEQVVVDRHTEAKNALMFIQEEQRGLKQLEKSIVELQQLFIDFAAASETHNQAIVELEVRTGETAIGVQQGVTHLAIANEYAIARRRRIAALITTVTFILLCIVGIVLAQLFTGFMGGQPLIPLN